MPWPTAEWSALKSKERELDVVCIGTALMDHLSFSSYSDLAELELSPGTMHIVDIETIRRIDALLGTTRSLSGGSEANLAAGVASLGGKPAFVGAVGDDEIGHRYEQDLRDVGVEPILRRAPKVGEEAASGQCHVIVTPDAQRTMATAFGVSGAVEASMITEDLIARSHMVYFDAYCLDFPDGKKITDHVVDLAQRNGTLLAIGLADPFAVERHHEVLSSLVGSSADLLFANELEALALTGADDVDGALEKISRPGLLSVITRAEHGAVFGEEAERLVIKAIEVPEVVDVTGAGDAFAAGVCFGLVHGHPIEFSARLGALCASEVIGHLGARPERALLELAIDEGMLNSSS